MNTSQRESVNLNSCVVAWILGSVNINSKRKNLVFFKFSESLSHTLSLLAERHRKSKPTLCIDAHCWRDFLPGTTVCGERGRATQGQFLGKRRSKHVHSLVFDKSGARSNQATDSVQL